MENHIQSFRSGLLIVAPRNSVVTIKPCSSTSGGHKIHHSTTTRTKQSSTSSYECLSNKNRCKIEHKATNSTSSTAKVKVTGARITNGKSGKKIVPRGGTGISGSKKSSKPGKVACKTEYKSSTSVKIKDRNGYTEYKKQEQITRVKYACKKSGISAKK